MLVKLDEMTHRQAGSFKEVLLPTGSVEQHGLHMPLGTDAIIARRICEDIAESRGIVLCPTFVFGFSSEHSGFHGTIDLGLRTFTGAVKRIVESLERSFERIYIINFHGGNSAALEAIVKDMARPNLHLIHFWRAVREDMLSMTDQGEIGIEHAGEFETSLMLAIRPDLVQDADSGPDKSISIKGERIHKKAWLSHEITPSGAFGGACWASEEKGKAFLKAGISRLVEIIDEIRADHQGD